VKRSSQELVENSTTGTKLLSGYCSAYTLVSDSHFQEQVSE
jgi:hypothetical protein